jgi:anthranilate phosphoribosyltransferase
MKKILTDLFEHSTLSRERAKAVMLEIGQGIYTEAEISSFITVYLMRSITIPELEGFRDALLELAVGVNLGDDLIDIVGTGGDGKNTFNISTLSSFIVAGTGNRVAKHGNYASSSVSGSSNVLEALGYKFTVNAEKLSEELEKAHICFLHAPLFHPALKTVGPVRQKLGMRTFFNLLGPLVNPAMPSVQLIGVYNLEIARIYNYILQRSGKAYTILHSLDGYDELSLTSDVKLITMQGEQVFNAVELGKRTVSPADIFGGYSIKESAAIFLKIISGNGSWAQNAVVIANAALALQCTKRYPDYETCYQLAVESLESGKAHQSLKALLS